MDIGAYVYEHSASNPTHTYIRGLYLLFIEARFASLDFVQHARLADTSNARAVRAAIDNIIKRQSAWLCVCPLTNGPHLR
jgi:hypothetical protein